MAAAPDVPCLSDLSGVHGRNISLVSSARPCNQSAVRTPPPYTPQATAAFAVGITFMMMLTIVGNILVIIAVLTSRSLKGPQNLFLVSLAAADILVATLIIPFSLANELQGYWAFSSVWCEIYLALDVLFCTSSIVHLCAVALDRYLSISRPVSYGARRTPLRIKASIVVVWLISAVISFPPLLTLDKSDGGERGCELNNERWYILYSTVGSFFAPCVIMILVYVRIYQIAKRHTRCPHGQKQKPTAGGNAVVATGESVAKVRGPSQSSEGRGGGTTSSRLEKTLNKMSSVDSTTSSHQRPPESTTGPSARRRPPRTSSIPRCNSQILSAVPDKESQRHPDEGGGAITDNTSNSSSDLDTANKGFPRENKSKGDKNKGQKETGELSQSKGLGAQALRLVIRHRSSVVTSSGTKLVPEGTTPPPLQGTAASRRKALVNREKRFTFVLAVVMGVFVICWFPFFLSYSLKAVCPETCSIPEPLFKFFFWIGYCNSCLNPVIYTIFNKDFRKAFKRILCRDTKGTFF